MNPSIPKPQPQQGITLSHVSTSPQQVSPDATPLACHRYNAIDRPALDPGSGPHTASVRCRHCGQFIRWLSQYTPADRQARRQQARRQQARQQVMAQKPPSPLQLVYLAALGDASPVPGTMLEASQRIDALVRGEMA